MLVTKNGNIFVRLPMRAPELFKQVRSTLLSCELKLTFGNRLMLPGMLWL